MPDTELGQMVVGIADRIDRQVIPAVEAMVGTLDPEKITKDKRRARRLRIWLWVTSVMAVVGLLADSGLTVIVFRQNDRQDRVVEKLAEASSALRVQCEAGNASIRNERDIWDHFILTSANQTRTPEQEAFRQESIAFLDSKLVEEDCS